MDGKVFFNATTYSSVPCLRSLQRLQPLRSAAGLLLLGFCIDSRENALYICIIGARLGKENYVSFGGERKCDGYAE
jgi:hypothetical protein